jgi:hypothetical protein
LKVLLAPENPFAAFARDLKGALDEEAASVPCSLSEYAVRILYKMTPTQRLTLAHSLDDSRRLIVNEIRTAKEAAR